MWVKAVPGASREEIAGAVGDRLKVRVTAPPEDGRANRAVCRLLAGALGLKRGMVEVESGDSRAEKVLRLRGVSRESVRSWLGLPAGEDSPG